MNLLCEYVIDQGYDLKLALEAKPNEPWADIYNPTTGHILAFIETHDHPEMVGGNQRLPTKIWQASTSCMGCPGRGSRICWFPPI